MADTDDPSSPAALNDRAMSEQDHMFSSKLSGKKLGRWRRVIGLLLLFVTVILWTATNFLASSIFADDTYSKPYFVTYVNTSFFVVPLIPILIHRAYKHPEDLRRWMAGWSVWARERRHSAVKNAADEGDVTSYEDSPPSHHGQQQRRRSEAGDSQELLLGESMVMEDSQLSSSKTRVELRIRTESSPLTLPETAWLSFEFCLLWFAANYCVAACLEYTTVASSTIITSTSSMFTLLFGSFFGVERFTLRKLFAVLASLTGIILISSLDLSGSDTDNSHRGTFPSKTFSEMAAGDTLALASALLYGLYAVVMKSRIHDETRVNMPLFFGLVGLINVLLLWPGFFILHFTGVERFELPPGGRVTTVVICNSVGSLISDLCWAYAVLLTSPIVVTVGLSMTIPLSLIGQILLNGQTASWVYWLGAGVVVLSFVFVSHERRRRKRRLWDLVFWRKQKCVMVKDLIRRGVHE